MRDTFSIHTRTLDLERMRRETFDVLVVGAGITGAAVARDAASRGLKVAVLEKGDVAAGASSASSKLVHGGLRYLPKLDLALIFESLKERTHLLQAAPHLVQPMPFFVPVRDGEGHGTATLRAGLTAYDLLSLGRAPHLHDHLDRDEMLQAIPGLSPRGLRGGFRYWDAAMWDDALCVETLRSARSLGAAVVTRLELLGPASIGGPLKHVRARDLEGGGTIEIRAHRLVVCAGAHTDLVCRRLDPAWRDWLRPSLGVHLVLPLSRLPLPGAVVLPSHEDGRMSFAIPRADLGAGVVLVGTTDEVVRSPEKPTATAAQVEYLLKLLGRTFPEARIGVDDVIATYAGVRPLLLDPDSDSLQAASREHRIEQALPGTVVVAGGKYTTHRAMAAEALECLVSGWIREADAGRAAPVPSLREPMVDAPPNPAASPERMEQAHAEAADEGRTLHPALLRRYAADALTIARDQAGQGLQPFSEPTGFPCFDAQLSHLARHEGVLHLDDVWFRRLPLFLSRADHALPWALQAARVLAETLGHGNEWANREVAKLREEIERREAWRVEVRAQVAA